MCFGGNYVGIISHGLSVGDAMSDIPVLDIGDGLGSPQIPAFGGFFSRWLLL